jgi:Matrixin
MIKARWCIYLLIGFFSLAALSASISAVTGAQPREVDDDDDEDALEDPLPDWVELRVFIHRPRVVKPNHLGTCVPTVNPNVDHFKFADWYLSGPIVWRLNRSTVPASVAGSVDSVLNQSFNTWSSGLFLQGPDARARRARFNGVNTILWKRLSRFDLGVTFVWFSRRSGEILEVDTVFNSRKPWAIFPSSPECQSSPDAYDLQNVATHEFGHWLGLDDLEDDSDRDLTMYGFAAGGEVKKRTLGRGDINGRNALEP